MADLPKFASNNRTVASGSLAYFGTYTVAEGTITFRLESSTFPNWDGQEQKRALTVSDDELKYTVWSSLGGTGTVVWKRPK